MFSGFGYSRTAAEGGGGTAGIWVWAARSGFDQEHSTKCSWYLRENRSFFWFLFLIFGQNEEFFLCLCFIGTLNAAFRVREGGTGR